MQRVVTSGHLIKHLKKLCMMCTKSFLENPIYASQDLKKNSSDNQCNIFERKKGFTKSYPKRNIDLLEVETSDKMRNVKKFGVEMFIGADQSFDLFFYCREDEEFQCNLL